MYVLMDELTLLTPYLPLPSFDHGQSEVKFVWILSINIEQDIAHQISFSYHELLWSSIRLHFNCKV